ncbi:phosphoribosylformylglycinamidine synthase subunit PurL [Alicyclobacillus sp. SO9]|uniref:phosphoribosylformylglycinamidine synthase subunit PurL n=1 Tax=Alicyclobacillus sp. SO9 TaxID=2665646 RepID=UPI0018E8AC0A|nr:phosphoribosylformylglycinamidine synthase subunit PurL [Alicyclobacillus sp. SO9]QQE78567.1 phosphoribosylformylglycinamidine synthase subunit PurL [Alicyclobacillus sp. SO9]
MAEPTKEQIQDQQIYRELGLTDDEYKQAVEKLGRLPNYLEAGLFGVLWSEHCSYKSSRPYLKNFPTEGPQVLQGPGENAGVVDIGDGVGIAFKMESHNHPSAVEPYQGAATGVGGILRDVFTMGARPIAFTNSLRFGNLDTDKTKYLFSHVVQGIGGYGNCVGVPTVAGEAVFNPTYTYNPLVNAMCVGVLPADKIVKGIASGVGNPVFVVGSRTGRDGIHGATFASAEDPNEKERSAVQVGDPFLGKLLLEACLELMETGSVVGIQDMGAAGLTSSSAEMASRAGGGLEMYLDKVPVRETGMTPYEMMLSESQERMLVVMERGQEQTAFDILEKWGLQVAEIGKVTDDGQLRLFWHGEVVADVPVRALVDEAPVYHRPVKAPETLPGRNVPAPSTAEGLDTELLKLLAHPSIADKTWIHRQYDTTVRASTYVGPGSDAAVVLVPGTERGVAMSNDGNGRYTYLNPRRGGAIAVAEAARNIVCSGGKPLAVTNCLNFGNPENPEIMYQFAEATAGMSEACKQLDTPVVSGNVSLYNQSSGEDIFPTPVIGAIGVVEDLRYVTPSQFVQTGSSVVLLGELDNNLDGSLFWELQAGEAAGDAPLLNLEDEAAVQKTVHEAIRKNWIRSAHDVSEGGLAVALAEMAMGTGMGVQATLPVAVKSDTEGLGYLFSEAQSRILVEVSEYDRERLLDFAKEQGVSAYALGTTGGTAFELRDTGSLSVTVAMADLEQTYTTALQTIMDNPAAQVHDAG